MSEEPSRIGNSAAGFTKSGADENLAARHPRFRGDWEQLAELERCRMEGKGNAWKVLVGSAGSNIHLEGADLRGMKFRGWTFSGVHLEDADLSGASLEDAYLVGTRLDRAILEGANLRRAILTDANLTSAVLSGASLVEAKLHVATLDKATLFMADIAGANLTAASCKRVNFREASLVGAVLRHAELEDAILTEASLDGADVRGSRDLLFDDNPVSRIRIDGNSRDKWSVLRRRYTGPWFFCHLFLLALFFAPYAGRVIALSLVAHGQSWAVREVEAITSRAQSDIAPRLQEGAAAATQRFAENFRQVPAAWVLIGGTRGGWALTLGGIVLIYNVLRLVLTLRVGMLRDAEERGTISPRTIEYGGVVFPLRTITRYSMDDVASAAPADEDVSSSQPAAPDTRTHSSRLGLKERWQIADADRLGLIGRIGLWRLHEVARVLLWIAVASVALHTAVWLITTTVPVPR